ncbi:GntR family transcriptional regulator [Micromonospora phytophila]|nr:GntR family transcriptional regulator [Micromonospora phytophila]MCM0676462.1 GntR family transcriptional regulator [Micromonospora phytophila]
MQQTYGVARGTVRMAMRELRDRGLVVTIHARERSSPSSSR